MKVVIILFGFLALLYMSAIGGPVRTIQSREEFAAIAYMPAIAGSAMVGPGATANVTIYIDSYSTDEETRDMSARFAKGQHKALRSALAKALVKGRIAFEGRNGYYELKLLRSKPTANGREIYGVGEHAIRFLDAYYPGRSKLDEFGIVQLDLRNEGAGEQGSGVLIHTARIKSFDGNGIALQNDAIEPVRLTVMKQ